jgi:hypothetical protein
MTVKCIIGEIETETIRWINPAKSETKAAISLEP